MNIGITGSIACGKSTVSDYLKEKGYTIIDADKLGHVALTSEDVKRRLSETFGANILVNNEISREVLGKLVFGNDNNLKKLNNIIHPKIKELILKLQEEHENEDLVFLDIASLGDFVINNSYRKEDTFQQIDEILEKLKRGDKQND